MTSNERKCPVVHEESLKNDIRSALITTKAFACPIAARLAWHSAGTFDKGSSTGGSNGAYMRFELESNDPANAGLGIARDILHVVKKKHPHISDADLWTYTGCLAIEFMGGPKIPFNFGREDHDGSKPGVPNGRLPDASKGADHVREVFTRMGFNDRETVALIGAHTIGRCHVSHSGYDGPWTRNPERFDNQFYRNLLNLEWKKKEWDGPLQYVDAETESLMMLPTDLALIEDPEYRKYVELYAKDQKTFFDDFADAFAKLISLGCPEHCQPDYKNNQVTESSKNEGKFREHAAHGSVDLMKKLASSVNVTAVEYNTGRNALHKAAYWGRVDATKYLIDELKMDVNVADIHGDTPLHDAARFGHVEVCKILLAAGADASTKNRDGHSALDLAKEYNKPKVEALFTAKSKL